MRQEWRGEERSVSRCGDGDVVGVGEGGGGGFGERRKSGSLRKRGRHAFVEYMAQREHHFTLDVSTGTAGVDRVYFGVVDQTIRRTRLI